MAMKLMQPPIQTSHILQPIASCGIIKIMTSHRVLTATRSKITKKCLRFCKNSPGFRTVALAKSGEQSFELIGGDKKEETQVDYKSTTDQIKQSLYDALQGINRGIFGVQSGRKAEIERLVELLESRNPIPEPTDNLEKMSGKWKLIYSTITILGSKRTKLGLRDFITLGDFHQNIDVIKGRAVNVIEFSARGLNLLNGQLRIEATFKRVDISYENSSFTPEQLMNVFKKNYDILLQIFNPEGWLEITYVDDDLRIGRDDKGNIFILERSKQDRA